MIERVVQQLGIVDDRFGARIADPYRWLAAAGLVNVLWPDDKLPD